MNIDRSMFCRCGGGFLYGGDLTVYWHSRFGGAAAYRVRANYARGAATQVIDGADTIEFSKFRYNGISRTNGSAACP